MKIGVFDSGVGGKSVAEAIKKAYPEAEVILEQDTANLVNRVWIFITVT